MQSRKSHLANKHSNNNADKHSQNTQQTHLQLSSWTRRQCKSRKPKPMMNWNTTRLSVCRSLSCRFTRMFRPECTTTNNNGCIPSVGHERVESTRRRNEGRPQQHKCKHQDLHIQWMHNTSANKRTVRRTYHSVFLVESLSDDIQLSTSSSDQCNEHCECETTKMECVEPAFY